MVASTTTPRRSSRIREHLKPVRQGAGFTPDRNCQQIDTSKNHARSRRASQSVRTAMVSGSSLTRFAETQARGSYSCVIGVDEAGRGPLAGPVVCAACYVHEDAHVDGSIMDSKQLDEAARERAYLALTNSEHVRYAVSIIDHNEIDRINILQATLLGMRNATNDLVNEISAPACKSQKKARKKSHTDHESERNSHQMETISSGKMIALIDGNRVPDNMPIQAKYVIKGDGSIYSIAAASIIAKVTRDRIMQDLHSQYPQYGFDRHKGYPTIEHRTVLTQMGPSKVHRMSYRPVKESFDRFGYHQ